MADKDRVSNVQKDVLNRLAVVIIENQDDLEAAAHNGRINAVAWLTRNLLELMVWTAYCAKSEDNAKQFLLDAGRDLTDTLRTVAKIFPDPTQPEIALQEFREWAKGMGLDSLEERYTAVAKAATEIGAADAFRDVNKLLSKFAHPTAMSVVNSGSETIEQLKRQVYGVGKRLAEQSLSLIVRLEKA